VESAVSAASLPPSPASFAPRFSPLTKWLIVSIASIGFAFDTYELLMLPLILRPALQEFGIAPGSAAFGQWRGMLFFVPAFAGGIFGLWGGYLTDRFGRRRVLTWSILLYAGSAFLSGFSTSPAMLLVLRCTTFIGVCVEFVAAVAWLAELFPAPEQRERVLGYTQAFSSVGGLLIAIVFDLVVTYAGDLPAVVMPSFAVDWLGLIDREHQHEAWRYALMSGLIPALPLIVIRPFLPESPIWAEKKRAGTLKRPSLLELFAPGLRRTTLVTTVMVACSFGTAFGAIQMIPQIVPGLQQVKQASQGKPKPAQRKIEQKAGAEYTKMQEMGGLLGRCLLAMLAVWVVSRRALMRFFQLPGLIVAPLVFYLFLRIENQTFFVIDLHAILLGELPVTTVSLGVFLVGLFTVAQFSFWGNYLPRVYPVHLRGTGESFAANIGGRMIGTSFAWVTSIIAVQPFVPGDSPPEKLAYTAAGVALFVYLVGSIACFFLPEPGQQTLPD
jgi:MFS family permease